MRQLSETVLVVVTEATQSLRGRKLPEINLDTRFREDLGCDSLDYIEIVMALEEQLGSSLSSDVIDGIRTVGDLVSALAAAKE